MPANRLVTKEEVAAYARVIFDAAEAEGGQDAVLEVRDSMEQIVGFVRTNASLATALRDTGYTPEQRADIARNVFAPYGSVLAGALAVMAERGDIDLLARVLRSYGEQIESRLHIAVVDVTTVVPLDDNLRDVIRKKAEADLGVKAVLREHIDTSILGGVILSANGRRIDASMASQLENARAVLKQSADGGEC